MDGRWGGGGRNGVVARGLPEEKGRGGSTPPVAVPVAQTAINTLTARSTANAVKYRGIALAY